MIYKYNFSISGDNFYPIKILNKIKGGFIVDSYFSPGDRKFDDNDKQKLEYGGISFLHPRKFCTEAEISKYESDFIDFIGSNFLLFKNSDVESLEIFMEIYYDGGQCNFEVFTKQALRKLADYKISLPISIYTLEYDEIHNWENEIKLEWERG